MDAPFREDASTIRAIGLLGVIPLALSQSKFLTTPDRTTDAVQSVSAVTTVQYGSAKDGGGIRDSRSEQQ